MFLFRFAEGWLHLVLLYMIPIRTALLLWLLFVWVIAFVSLVPVCAFPVALSKEHLRPFGAKKEKLVQKKLYDRNYFMGNSESTTKMSGSIRSEIDSDIQNNDVMIFSKSYCPYCVRAKDAIKAQNVQFKTVELDVRIKFFSDFFM